MADSVASRSVPVSVRAEGFGRWTFAPRTEGRGRELAEDNHIVTKGWLGEHMLPGREVGQWEFISKETPKDFIWTCFYYHNTRTLANMCRVLGKKEEEG